MLVDYWQIYIKERNPTCEAMWRNNQTGMQQYNNDEEQLTSYAFLPRSRAAFNQITAENTMFIRSVPKHFGNDWLFLFDPCPLIAMKMSLENWIFLLTFSLRGKRIVTCLLLSLYWLLLTLLVWLWLRKKPSTSSIIWWQLCTNAYKMLQAADSW